MLLTEVHELLAREGILVPYQSLHRFAQTWCDFGKRTSITVRKLDAQSGEFAEVDFGRLDCLQGLPSNNPRVYSLIMALGSGNACSEHSASASVARKPPLISKHSRTVLLTTPPQADGSFPNGQELGPHKKLPRERNGIRRLSAGFGDMVIFLPGIISRAVLAIPE